MPPTGLSAVPLDLLEHEWPRLFHLRVDRWGTHHVLAIVNWNDEPAPAHRLPLARLGVDSPVHVFDVWRGALRGVMEDAVAVPEIAAHGVVLLRLTPVAPEPELVGSTFHLAQGAAKVTDLRWTPTLLEVRLDLRHGQSGELFIALPPGTADARLSVDGA